MSGGRPAARRRGPLLRVALVTVFVVAAGWGMWQALGHDMDGVRQFLARPAAVGWIVCAALLDLAGLTLGMVSWRNLVTGLGYPLGLGPTVRVYGAAMLGKYLPGPFWSGLASVQMGRSSGVPAARMVAAYALNSALVLLTAGAVGLAAAPSVMNHSALLMAPAMALLGVLVWRPQLIVTFAALVSRVLRRPPPGVVLADGPLRRSIGAQLVSWVVGGLHLYLIVAVLGGPTGPGAALLYVGGFSLASAAGMLALVVPDGAGVREVVLTLALSPVLDLRTTLTAVVVSRLACTLAEVCGSTLALAAAAWTARRRPAPVLEPHRSPGEPHRAPSTL